MTENTIFPPSPQTPAALVLEAHPQEHSFNAALATAYREGMEGGGVPVRTLRLQDLSFNLNLEAGYRDEQALEPDLETARSAIAQAAHLTIAFPVWWGSTPAKLKGFFDRVFLPKWAFTYDKHGFPIGGLRGRSGRIILTMDAPTIYDAVVYRASARTQVSKATLAFCGIKPIKISAFGSIKKSSVETRKAMLSKSHKAGKYDAKKILKRFD